MFCAVLYVVIGAGTSRSNDLKQLREPWQDQLWPYTSTMQLSRARPGNPGSSSISHPLSMRAGRASTSKPVLIGAAVLLVIVVLLGLRHCDSAPVFPSAPERMGRLNALSSVAGLGVGAGAEACGAACPPGYVIHGAGGPPCGRLKSDYESKGPCSRACGCIVFGSPAGSRPAYSVRTGVPLTSDMCDAESGMRRARGGDSCVMARFFRSCAW